MDAKWLFLTYKSHAKENPYFIKGIFVIISVDYKQLWLAHFLSKTILIYICLIERVKLLWGMAKA